MPTIPKAQQRPERRGRTEPSTQRRKDSRISRSRSTVSSSSLASSSGSGAEDGNEVTSTRHPDPRGEDNSSTLGDDPPIHTGTCRAPAATAGSNAWAGADTNAGVGSGTVATSGGTSGGTGVAGTGVAGTGAGGKPVQLRRRLLVYVFQPPSQGPSTHSTSLSVQIAGLRRPGGSLSYRHAMRLSISRACGPADPTGGGAGPIE